MMPGQPPASSAAPAEPEVPETVPDESLDMTNGYCVNVHVRADGTFSVSMEAEPDNAAEGEAAEPEGESFDNLGDALKQVIRVVRDNPIGESEQANFEAGYGAPKAPLATAPMMEKE